MARPAQGEPSGEIDLDRSVAVSVSKDKPKIIRVQFIRALLALIGWTLFGEAEVLAQRMGKVHETRSKLDGEHQIHVEHAWLKGKHLFSPNMAIGAFWTSKSPDDIYLLIALIEGGVPQELKIGIDGQITELKPLKEAGTSVNLTDRTWAIQRRYKVPAEFLGKIVAGKSVVVQVGSSEHTQHEGEVGGGNNMARAPLKKGWELIEKARKK